MIDLPVTRRLRSRPTLVLASFCAILLASVVAVRLYFAGTVGTVSLQDATAEGKP